jgi:hypothetical protein
MGRELLKTGREKIIQGWINILFSPKLASLITGH